MEPAPACAAADLLVVLTLEMSKDAFSTVTEAHTRTHGLRLPVCVERQKGRGERGWVSPPPPRCLQGRLRTRQAHDALCARLLM